MTKLENKIEESVEFLNQYFYHFDYRKGKVAFSGGKDSVVLYHFLKKFFNKEFKNFDIVYQNTTIDPPGTIQFIKKNFLDVIIQNPSKSFYKLVENKGLPNRWQRWCCAFLKENTNDGYDIVFTGVRKSESVKRSNYDWISNRKDVIEIRPLLFWTDRDIWEFIRLNNLPVIKYYKPPYNYKRHGCVMCPLVNSHQRIKEARDFPRYAKALIIAIRKFRENKPDLKFVQSFKNEYEMFYLYLLGELNAKGRNNLKSMLFDFDAKKELENLLKIKL